GVLLLLGALDGLQLLPGQGPQQRGQRQQHQQPHGEELQRVVQAIHQRLGGPKQSLHGSSVTGPAIRFASPELPSQLMNYGKVAPRYRRRPPGSMMAIKGTRTAAHDDCFRPRKQKAAPVSRGRVSALRSWADARLSLTTSYTSGGSSPLARIRSSSPRISAWRAGEYRRQRASGASWRAAICGLKPSRAITWSAR